MNLLQKRMEDMKDRMKEQFGLWEPVFIDLGSESGRKLFSDLLDLPGTKVFDEIFDQITELIRCRNPKIKWNEVSKNDAVTDFLQGQEISTYGVWVYYPWNGNLVHLLPRDEFIDVRTSRNEYKITRQERAVLAQKKVGVIGLSVGQSVSVTLAMERGFGEIRLADFDVLELTNLNRIRSGVHNLGLSKVVMVAREIMEIDPYIVVKCFGEGLHEGNMDSFFMDGGKLDMLIDECDGLDIKVLARFKAKELGIPVLMEASDRATVDVERFDLEPTRPILHGLIDKLNPESLKELKTNEDKVPYMLAIVGLDTISTRAKASMIEIGESISTWPQLASAVTLGGGITADVCRRIFLDQFRTSGRYRIDLDELIGDKKTDYTIPEYPKPQPEEAKQIWWEILNNIPGGKPLPQTSVFEIMRAAHHAPSGGNLQPWHWMNRGDKFLLFFKENLKSSFLDAGNMASYIALGASVENAVLAAQKLGYHTTIEYFPKPEMDQWIATLTLSEGVDESGKTTGDIKLEDFIFQRHTNRNIEVSANITTNEMECLALSAEQRNCSLKFFEAGNEKSVLENCISAIERFRILNEEGYRNFMEEMRWTKEEAEKTRDGIDLATCDLTPADEAGFRIARHRDAVALIRDLRLGKGLEKLSKKATSAAPAIGMVCVPNYTNVEILNGGRALERVWIAANAMGIGFQPQSPITLLIKRAETGQGLSAFEKEELDSLINKLYNLVPKNQHPLFIFRLFKGKRLVVKSLRRDISHHFSSFL